MRSVARVWWCAAVMALLCALPSSASAASRTKRRSSRTQSTSTPAPTPEETAPKDTTAEATSSSASAKETAPAPVVTTVSSSAQAEPPPHAGGPAGPSKYFATVGAGPSMSLEGGPAAFEVMLRGAVAIPASVGQALLMLVVPLRLTMVGQTTDAFGLPVKSSGLGIAIVPSLQLSTALLPQLRGYGAFGVGPAHFRVSTEVPYLGYQSGNTTVLEFDLTAGVDYALSDRFWLFFEPMGLRLFAGRNSEVAVSGNGYVVVWQGSAVPTMWTMLLGVRMDL